MCLPTGIPEWAAPPFNCCRSDAHDGGRRRPVTDYGAPSALGGEEEDGEAQEDDVLTLGTCGCSAWSEEVRDGGNRARSAAAGEEGDDVELTNGGTPA